MSNNHTIETIADLAGVSRSTVSRVINEKDNVSDKVRKKVLEIIEQENYYPDASARSLASKKTNNIGIVFWGSNPLFLTQPIYYEIMQGIQKQAIQKKFDIMLYTSEKKDKKLCSKIIGQKAVDGLIIMGHVMYLEYLRLFFKADFPVTIIGKRFTENLNVPFICSDYINGIYEATKYLIELNHKKIMMIVSDKESLYEKEKIKGFKKALQTFDLEIDDDLIVERNTEEDLKIFDEIIKNKKIDGIITSSDSIALKAIKGLKKFDYNIPTDISVIGFDNTQIAENINPPLTTVNQQKEKLGEKAVNMLIRQIKGKNVNPKILSTELVKRESVQKR